MKKMMLLVLAAAISLSAAFVPVDRASKVATNQYMNYCADASVKGVNIVNVVENKYEGETTWYAFEFEQGGFVIVSADDTVRPILGYSDHGKVVSLDRNGGQNFKEWFNKYDRQILFMRKNAHVDPVGQKTWKDIESNVFPSTKAAIIVDALIKSQWDQVYPWNDLCPPKDDTFTYVGCIATAMVQIMRYHQWPDVGVGSSQSYSPFTGLTLPATNFTTHTWNYGLMPLTIDGDYGYYPEYWETYTCSQAEIDELALQSYWTGLSVNMAYGTTAEGGSGSNMTYAASAFVDHWKGTVTGPTSFATPLAGAADASYATIIAPLNLGKPWDWAGGAHSFNLDGYRDDSWYHFNWGWWGSYDGWFHRSSLIPGGIGSGGDDGDFTDGQQGISYTPSGQAAFATTTASGSVSGYTVTVNWLAKAGATGYELYGRADDFTDDMELITTTTGLTHVMNEVPAGYHYYRVVVKYATGQSNWSNIYTANVISNANLNPPMAVRSTTVGRTGIDLTWTAPYAGVLNFFESFEGSMDLPAGWTYKASGADAGWLASQETYGFVANIGEVTHWAADYTKMVAHGVNNFFLNSSGMPDGDPAPVAPEVLMWGWLLSPKATMDASSTVKYWGRFRILNADGTLPAAPAAGWPAYDVVSYLGSYSEVGTTRITHRIHQSFIINSVATNNVFDRQETVSLATAAGEYTRVGFKVKENVYSTCIDEITIGSTSTIPPAATAYKIYRNGALAYTTSNGTTYSWTDTAFADGVNTYYATAMRTATESIKSNYSVSTIDANPKPGFLTGTVATYTVANLSWYAPYHNAPIWYANPGSAPEECTSWTYMDATFPMKYRKVSFKGSELGFYYPVTLDSIASAFYNDGLWTGSTFTFRVWYNDDATPLTPTILHTSTTQTAVHNKITKYKIPTPLTLTKDFVIEIVTVAADGSPWSLMGKVPTSHSYTRYDDGTGETYTWNISYTDGDWAEYCHMAHLSSSAPPPIAKDARIINDGEPKPALTSGWTTSAPVEETKAMLIENPKFIKSTVKGSKALTYYKIYRDDVFQAQTTSLTWQQTAVPAGDHSYAVTALYANPTGESGYSIEDGNEIILGFGTPPVISLPASISPTTQPDTSTPASFSIGNTGQAGLDYSMTNAYVGYLVPGGTYISNDFTTFPGTGWTNTGWVASAGAARATGSAVTCTLTSPAANTSAAGATVYLDFTQNFVFKTGSWTRVEYYTGSAWVQIYYATAATTAAQHIALPIKSATTQVRFTGYTTRVAGATATWDIDNIVVSSAATPHSWLTFVSPTTGIVAGGSSNTINLTCNAAGLVAGTYVANITVASDDPVNPTKVLNVQFVVSATGPIIPAVPANVVTTVVGTDVLVNWDDSADATSYDVYSSADPYGTFTLLTNVAVSQYTYTPGTNAKRFFYIKAKNATKDSPRTIEIAKPVTR
jgi:hypothetical protein